MAKNVLLIMLVLAFAYALWIYQSRDVRSPKDSVLGRDVAEPKLEIESFVAQRYRGGQIINRIQARLGQYSDPNILELFGDFRIEEFSEHRRELVSSDSAIATFDMDTARGVTYAGELNKVKLRGDVQVDFQPYRLLTDYAEYLGDSEAIVSSRPVTVVGEKKWFKGQGGFKAQMSHETVEVYGKVNGEAYLEK